MSVFGLELLSEINNNIELGLIVIDSDDNICLWNSFMVNHSTIKTVDVMGKELFDVFPALPKIWLKLKLKGVRQLKNISKVSWEQRPILFEFKYGGTMLQNCSFIPISDPVTGDDYVCITIQNVSDFAKDKLDLNEMIQINRSLEEISSIDFLTEIYNRRYILEQLESKITNRDKAKDNLTLVMFDLDHFKSVNDNYGHIAGDRVLKYVSKTVSDSLLPNSLFGRYGGEEFLLIFCGNDLAEISAWVEQIRIKIHKGSVPTNENEIKVTASFGIAEFTAESKDYFETLHRADVAMYRSKNSGRNRVTLYS
ncbi:MAG: GGDEF domain-containing protein [Spirochaetaceae bacterium]